jgi:hypothetical protein
VRLVSLVFHNFLYKLVSVVVAVVLWSATQGFRAVDVSVDLPVEFQDAPSDLVIVGPYTREVNFKIAGSRWAVRRAVQKLQRYPISLEGFKPGDHRFEVTPDLLNLPRGATILARAPTNITVKLDAMVEKAVRVRAELVGDPPPGLKLEGVEVEPSVITLRGARTVLNNLREVLTEAVDLSEFRATSSRQLPLVLGSSVWPADKKNATVRVLVRVVSDRPQEDPLEAVPGAGQS